MAVGKYQRNASGREPRNADGRTYRNTVADDPNCCCVGGTNCPFCDIAPVAYDLEFSGVHTCPTFTIDGHTFHATYGGDPGPLEPIICGWFGGILSTSADLGIASDGAFIDMYVQVGLSFIPAFQSAHVAYGPDCSQVVLATNGITSCGPPTASGWGGSATGVAVMPP